jgi:diaminopimelate decarboxylase
MVNEKNINERTDISQGMLKIGGVPADKLAAVCGTPLFVYDETELEKKMRGYREHFRSEMFETEVIYASKAFACKALLFMLKRFGFGIDVVSGENCISRNRQIFPWSRSTSMETINRKKNSGWH